MGVFHDNSVDYGVVLRLQKPLETYIELFEGISKASLRVMDGLVDVMVTFEDPVHRLRGNDAFMEVMQRRVDYAEVRLRVDDFVWGRKPATAYVHAKRAGGDESVVIELGFTDEGRVILHREYWSGGFPYGGRKYAKAIVKS